MCKFAATAMVTVVTVHKERVRVFYYIVLWGQIERDPDLAF
jgi:hypothetical protein